MGGGMSAVAKVLSGAGNLLVLTASTARAQDGTSNRDRLKCMSQHRGPQVISKKGKNLKGQNFSAASQSHSEPFSDRFSVSERNTFALKAAFRKIGGFFFVYESMFQKETFSGFSSFIIYNHSL
jgi:hypothetical protein